MNIDNKVLCTVSKVPSTLPDGYRSTARFYGDMDSMFEDFKKSKHSRSKNLVFYKNKVKSIIDAGRLDELLSLVETYKDRAEVFLFLNYGEKEVYTQAIRNAIFKIDNAYVHDISAQLSVKELEDVLKIDIHGIRDLKTKDLEKGAILGVGAEGTEDALPDTNPSEEVEEDSDGSVEDEAPEETHEDVLDPDQLMAEGAVEEDEGMETSEDFEDMLDDDLLGLSGTVRSFGNESQDEGELDEENADLISKLKESQDSSQSGGSSFFDTEGEEATVEDDSDGEDSDNSGYPEEAPNEDLERVLQESEESDETDGSDEGESDGGESSESNESAESDEVEESSGKAVPDPTIQVTGKIPGLSIEEEDVDEGFSEETSETAVEEGTGESTEEVADEEATGQSDENSETNSSLDEEPDSSEDPEDEDFGDAGDFEDVEDEDVEDTSENTEPAPFAVEPDETGIGSEVVESVDEPEVQKSETGSLVGPNLEESEKEDDMGLFKGRRGKGKEDAKALLDAQLGIEGAGVHDEFEEGSTDDSGMDQGTSIAGLGVDPDSSIDTGLGTENPEPAPEPLIKPRRGRRRAPRGEEKDPEPSVSEDLDGEHVDNQEEEDERQKSSVEVVEPEPLADHKYEEPFAEEPFDSDDSDGSSADSDDTEDGGLSHLIRGIEDTVINTSGVFLVTSTDLGDAADALIDSFHGEGDIIINLDSSLTLQASLSNPLSSGLLSNNKPMIEDGGKFYSVLPGALDPFSKGEMKFIDNILARRKGDERVLIFVEPKYLGKFSDRVSDGSISVVYYSRMGGIYSLYSMVNNLTEACTDDMLHSFHRDGNLAIVVQGFSNEGIEAFLEQYTPVRYNFSRNLYSEHVAA